MENSVIKLEIQRLQSEFNINFGILDKHNGEIVAQMLQLQNQCTHRHPDNTRAYAAPDYRCEYCGRIINE